MKRLLATLFLGLFFVGVRAHAQDDFFKDVQPILQKHCVRCHGPANQKWSPPRHGYDRPRRQRRRQGHRARQIRGQPDREERSSARKTFRLCRRRLGHGCNRRRSRRFGAGSTPPRSGRPRGRRSRSRRQRSLGVPADRPARVTSRRRRSLGQESDRSLHPGPAAGRDAETVARSRSADIDPPAQFRSHRLAADARRGHRRHPARRLRTARRSAPTVASIRRTLGPALARSGPLRRSAAASPSTALARCGRTATG